MEQERCVVVNSTFGLYRVVFGGKKPETRQETGEVIPLMAYFEEDVPLGAAVIKWGSKLIFVGGEDYGKALPFHQTRKPRPFLPNKCVYVCRDWNPEKPSRGCLSSHCSGPKPLPFVVPVKTGTKTLFYVLAGPPQFASFSQLRGPFFEVFDPEKEEWHTPQQPDPRAVCSVSYCMFELAGRIFILSPRFEASFCLQSQTWGRTTYFGDRSGALLPWSMLAVEGLSDKIRIGIGPDASVYAYKLLDENDCEPRVAAQCLSELDPFLSPLHPDYPFGCHPFNTELSNLGYRQVLFMSSLCAGVDPVFAHCCFLKIQFHEPPATRGRTPFVYARVLDSCYQPVPMMPRADQLPDPLIFRVQPGFVL